MPRELRITINAVIPIPDGGSAFDDARTVLAFEDRCTPLAQAVVEADGAIECSAAVVSPKPRQAARPTDAPSQHGEGDAPL